MSISVAKLEQDVVNFFLTGATGFLGKVVLEEIFRRRAEYNLGKVIILMRTKHGENPKFRFREQIAISPCFRNLPKDWIEFVQVIEGDVSQNLCGIDPAIYTEMCSTLTHIIHCAGSISFTLSTKEAAHTNVGGTMNVFKLAKACPRLQRLVTTSTAYTMPDDIEAIYEELPQLPYQASEILADIRINARSDAEFLRLSKFPNTYTLTKALTEHIIVENAGDFPVTIVRPSIISASRLYPFPGWIDSFAGIAAAVAAIGTGILQVLEGDPKTVLDVVPVDDVARRLIDEALFPDYSTLKPKIIYAAATLRHAIKIEIVARVAAEYANTKNSTRGRKARVRYIGPRNTIFHASNFLHHRVPFFLATKYFWLKRDSKMEKRTKKAREMVRAINRVFPYYCTHSFDFRCESELLEQSFDKDKYLRIVCYGVAEFLLKSE